MERASSAPSVEENGEETLSCGGCLKMKLPWTKRRDNYMKHKTNGCNITATLCSPTKKPKPRGGFRYDPLSYAQNFDDGGLKDDNGDYYSRGFSSRFVVPPATTKSTVAQTPGRSQKFDRRSERRGGRKGSGWIQESFVRAVSGESRTYYNEEGSR
ncbi:hypothetical protein Nepgr_015904 [Nepenthes gracilis]|uniref:Uncharacterized protein n=1 Tax=Nepenthes gracilis TaxID=150966 RepID=A0AAD3SMJ6_NEPGR|nr:hypothetical protein Nepgr_015904 [Nepenthes gracilis]